MKYLKIESNEQFRLDRFIIRMYGEYSQYYVDVLNYFNPQIDFINLVAGITLKVPSRAEINSITKIRGYYDLQMDAVPRIRVLAKNDIVPSYVTPAVPPVPIPVPEIEVRVNMGDVVEGSVPVTQEFRIYNDGTVDLNISLILVPPKFQVTVAAPLVIAAGSTGDFTVSLIDTTIVGTFGGDIDVFSDAGTVTLAVTAEVITDPTRTRIPVLNFYLEGVRAAENVLYCAPITAFDWEWPDGTLHNEVFLSHNPARGSVPETCFIVLKAGHSWSEIIYLNRSYAHVCEIQTEDTQFLNVTWDFYNPGTSGFAGDIAYLGNAVASTNFVAYFVDGNKLYGDVTDWPATKCHTLYLANFRRVHGVLSFIANSPLKFLALTYSVNFTPAEISQTIVNWDACNAAAFARTGLFQTVKRSELTVAGESATRSLVIKTTTFTFMVEDIPVTNPAYYTVLLRDTNFTIDGTGVIVAARGTLTITGENMGAGGITPSGIEVAMGTVDATSGSYSKNDCQLVSGSFAQNDIVRIKLTNLVSGRFVTRYVVAGA